ncbi:Armadillo-type [Corchorus olitorius]|uniref:Armadillo-type n=1 Tax=Corchorus olitorius TaxID=93759 RepID=A0A1R3GI03_9ROSI|nr:Armadillo-type [Corchorus olitorius]
MSNLNDQIEEVKTLLSSNSNTNKSFGYSTLLHFQEQSSDSPPSIQALCQSSRSLIDLIIADIHDEDEEIAAQALKCVGFMIYHPSIVAKIPAENAKLVLESLAKVITVTKMKSVCNLGVWCISIQQFDEALLAACFDTLLCAAVHALDNPIGSLSTTFEAMQAVTKLAAQLSEKMRQSSHLWVPPIYRRLLSIDKRERDMSERCLLKIRSNILPPPVSLSKAIVQDMKQKLLAGMKEQLEKGMKVQTLQAWRWFISFLGSDALKNRHLLNDMLKVPEQTFSDHNSQVQIASLVAWEGLIDALVHPQILGSMKNAIFKHEIQRLQTSPGESSELQYNGFSKSLKLIMTPLIGIILSKCDLSVHFSCLNTWCYLLHRLDKSINSPSVIKLVLDPMFEAIFKIGPGSRNIWLWNLCLDLLDDCISAKCSNLNSNPEEQVNRCLSAKTSISGPSMPGGYSWKQYPIKWLPWDLTQLDFYLKMIAIIITHGAAATATAAPESRKSAREAAVRILRSVLKGVQMEFRNPLNNYDNIMFCLNSILKFIKNIAEDASSEGAGLSDMFVSSHHLIEAVMEELEPSITGSPLYMVALDIKYVGSLDSVEIKHAKILHQRSIAYMDMVSPMVYLTVLYISLVVQAKINTPEMELVLRRFESFFKSVLSSHDPLESFLASVALLYRHMDFNYIEIWMALVRGLNGYIDGMKNLYLFERDSDNSVYKAIYHLLSYPFILFSCPLKDLAPLKTRDSLKEFFVSLERKLEQAFEAWKSLYGSVSDADFNSSARNTFCGDLCAMLDWCLDENGSMFEYKSELGFCYKDLEPACFSFFGKVVVCILETKLTTDASENECGGDFSISSVINYSLKVASRFMKVLHINLGTEQSASLVSSRLFSALAHFVSSLHLKQDILSYFEFISCPLLQWLSHQEIQDESVNDQLGVLWAESLNCLQRSQPPITFDSSFLKLQACLLEKTLGHTNTLILDPTIIFWNSTYGRQINLEYPQNLLHVLDKLSRNGRIKLYNRSKSFLERCSRIDNNTAPQSCKVTATQNRSSKRVELTDDMIAQLNQTDKPPLHSKRKRLELTEHQKEVRRAQQGKERDCSGHGPGIRTYTSLDFSQGNGESQESQDNWDSEAILETLRRGS